METDSVNTHLKLSVSNLGLRVKTGSKEMQREMQKVSGDTGEAESHQQVENSPRLHS